VSFFVDALNFLSVLIKSSSEIVGEYGARPLYRMLGYFSLIGLLRVHSLLGDFTLALKVMENVELNQKV
jgi:translation initiation factor 3 subunit L